MKFQFQYKRVFVRIYERKSLDPPMSPQCVYVHFKNEKEARVVLGPQANPNLIKFVHKYVEGLAQKYP